MIVHNVEINYTYKILIAGEGGVGKTTMLYRYVDGKFIDNFTMTIGVGFQTKIIQMDDLNYQLSIWDFGGQERFREILKDYMRGGMGALLVFDLSRHSTVRDIDDWITLLYTEKAIPIVLVGSKADLPDADSENDYSDLVNQYNFVDYIKTSSKTGENVDLAFRTLLSKIIELEKNY